MGSFAQGALIERTTSTTNSGGTTSLTNSSASLQRFTGSTTQTVVLPDATSLLIGRYFIIENESDSNITVNYNGGTLAAYVASGTQRSFELFGNSSSVGDWVIGNQLDIDGPLALHATRPSANANLNIRSNQISSGTGNILSTAPIDDVINIFPDTYINMVFYAQTGGVYGGTVYTESGTFTRPSIASGSYTRLVISYVTTLNAINTKFSAASLTPGGLTNPGTLFAAIEGMPIGYVDLKSLGSWNFCTANSLSAIIENKDIVKFSAGTGTGGGDSSFKFQTISSNVLTIKKGFLILNDGRELYSPSDFTIDLTTVSGVDGTYYGYIDLANLTLTPTYLNGRKLYQVVSSNIYFSTASPDSVGMNLSRFLPLGVVQRSSGTWANQQTTALRRHDNVVVGVDASLEYSTSYTTVGNVGSSGQIKAGHVLDAYSFPTTIASSNISWYGLTNASDSSTNGRNLTPNGSPLYTDTDILGVADTFAPDGVNDYLSSTQSFFNPGPTVNFAFGLWFKADSYVGTHVLVSNWGVGNKSYKLQLNGSNIEFVTTSDGSTETTTMVYDSTVLGSLSGWNQVIVSYNTSGSLFSFYLNSNFLVSISLTIFSGTSTFNLAAANGANVFAGSIDEFFFINGNYLTQDAVSKLFCTKITHNRKLTTTNQRWSAFVTDSNTDIERQLFTNFPIDITLDSLYADFSDQSSTAKIALKMHNAGNLGVCKPTKARTLLLTAAELDALMPLSHNLYDVPCLKLQVDEGGSQFSTHNDASYFVATNTQIISTGISLASMVGGSTIVRFTYSVGGESINSRLLGSYIIVGSHPDADFSDLWSALSATSTLAGSRILVISDQSTSVARTISNNNIYIEFLPGVKITSTVAAGTALTFNGVGTVTKGMTLVLNGNANGILISGVDTEHSNLSVKIGGTVTTVLLFDAISSNNYVEGNIQIAGGSFTNSVIDNTPTTTPTNIWEISTSNRIQINAPGAVPVGGMVAVMPHLPNSWQPPLSGQIKDGFMRADGNSVPAGCTIPVGTVLPSMTARYPRGNTTSGTTGGSNTVTLSASQIPQLSSSFTSGGVSQNHTHTGTGTSDKQSANHHHTGTSGGASVDHTHTGTGISGGISQNHYHSGTTGGQNSNTVHDHATVNSGNMGQQSGWNAAGGGGYPWVYSAPGSPTTGLANTDHTHSFTTSYVSHDHTHTTTITTGGVSLDHSHTTTTGDQSADHTHTTTITTGNQSADHTHSTTVTLGTASPSTVPNEPSYVEVVWVIRVL